MCVESRGGCCSRLPGDIGNVVRGLAYERRLRLSWVAPGSGGAAVGGGGQVGAAEELRLFIWLLPGPWHWGMGTR